MGTKQQQKGRRPKQTTAKVLLLLKCGGRPKNTPLIAGKRQHQRRRRRWLFGFFTNVLLSSTNGPWLDLSHSSPRTQAGTDPMLPHMLSIVCTSPSSGTRATNCDISLSLYLPVCIVCQKRSLRKTMANRLYTSDHSEKVAKHCPLKQPPKSDDLFRECEKSSEAIGNAGDPERSRDRRTGGGIRNVDFNK